MFEQLQEYLTEAANHIRLALQRANQHDFCFEVEISGRCDGDVMLTYHIGSKYGSNRVSGQKVKEVLAEHLRRIGWTERNDPICLPKPEEPVSY